MKGKEEGGRGDILVTRHHYGDHEQNSLYPSSEGEGAMPQRSGCLGGEAGVGLQRCGEKRGVGSLL
jgi:hypothetical protein